MSGSNTTTIVQISDCHLFADPAKTGYQNIAPYTSLEQILAKISQMSFDLLLVTGDISGDDSAQSYQHFVELMISHNMRGRIKVIPGNHDNNPHFDEILAPFMLESSSPMTLGAWKLHGLDTRHKGTLGQHKSHALEAIRNHVEASSDYFHILACHHHPFDTASWMDKHAYLNRQELVEMVCEAVSIKAVVYGHIHQDAWQQHQQCYYLACPSTCWQWKNSLEFSVDEVPAGFRVIELDPHGSVSSMVVRL